MSVCMCMCLLLHQLGEQRGTRAACMGVCVSVCIQHSLPGGSGCVQLAGWNLLVAPKGWPYSHGFPLNLAALWLPCPVSTLCHCHSLTPPHTAYTKALFTLSFSVSYQPSSFLSSFTLASSSSTSCCSLHVASRLYNYPPRSSLLWSLLQVAPSTTFILSVMVAIFTALIHTHILTPVQPRCGNETNTL